MKTPHQQVLNSRFAALLIESMAEGVFTLDRDGRISSWNNAMERISGYTIAEAMGDTCRILGFNNCFTRKCPGGVEECGIYRLERVDTKECSIRHKEGHDVPVLKNARLVRDDRDQVVGVVETVTDLTELTSARLRAEEASRRLGEIHRYGNIIGKSDSMQRVFSSIRAGAASDATVLVRGESGTGKEMVASAIHYHSDRREQPLVTVNCSALSESLLESELFGHVRGAFTGAVAGRAGRFEEAHGGTIFLDEIGEISPFIQVKLLRVLQEREIERVGESRKRNIDIRIITATNRDLLTLVGKGSFREDLYYRLKVFPIDVPPLWERKGDIPLLNDHFIERMNRKTGKKISGIAKGAMRILMDYPWPGNVRELENAIEHAFVLCGGETIFPEDLPVEIRDNTPARVLEQVVRASPGPVEKLTRKTLLALLSECGWNKAEAARRAGVSRTMIWKHMKRWDIPLKEKK